MKNYYEEFKNYHYQNDPLLLGNVWDAQSALQLQNLGFKALGTSSAAIANMLGYDDGENMPFNEYLMIIKRILANSKVPVSVDLEAGYGSDAEAVVENIKELVNLGVVGINLEDSVVHGSSRTLVAPAVFAKKLESIHEKLNNENIEIFINLRIDTFLLQLPNAVEESKERIDLYSEFMDGIFLPCIAKKEDIEEITSYTNLPLNVMSIPGLPDFEVLKNLGVKRISTGNFLYDFLNQTFKREIESLLELQSFDSFFKKSII